MPNEKQSPYDFSIAPGVWGKKDVFVNYYMIEDSETDSWFLVDAGLRWSVPKIKAMANYLFGEDSKPAGIILTHGHFDHVGALHTLAKEWAVPIYAHRLEIPYLTGKSSYPPADPTVGGGMMSAMSWMYPKGPIDIHQFLHVLPDNNSIPGLSDWQYIHTPGHAPGHISLFRESDKVLIAGDAVVTTQQESIYYALSYKKKLSGPPKYFTCNWQAAKISIMKLTALDPEIIATGHGEPMKGEEMRSALSTLSKNFEHSALPARGRYLKEPAITSEKGVVFVPPAEALPVLKLLGVSLVLLSVAFILQQSKRKPDKSDVKNIIKKLKKASQRYQKVNHKLANLQSKF
jgi:glyoxylase-like metal-dependent hydrolase (beta-lactamase superfamily II)